MNKKKKYVIIAIILLSIVVLTSIGTYAWYVWRTDNNNETLISTRVGGARVIFDGGKSILGANLRPTATKEEGIVKTITIRSEVQTGLRFNLYLDVDTLDEGLKDASFKYELFSFNERTIKANGDFSIASLDSNLVNCDINNTNHIVLLSDELINTTDTTYVLYIWIDGTMPNPDAMQNKNFAFKLHADGTDAVIGETSENNGNTLSTFIVNKYANSDKTVVVNNSISYEADTVNSLIQDVDNNVRYYGSNPNNYIYFNCTDYDNQTDSTCEKWRIIGVFGNSVKIQRGAPLGTTYAWDSGGVNNWTTASLNTYLNGTYYNSLTNKTKDFIDTKEWKLGGACTTTGTNYCIQGVSNVFPDVVYGNEKGTRVYSGSGDNIVRDASWTGKIALAYPSDYKYATITGASNNWMRDSMGLNFGWLLTPASNSREKAWAVKTENDTISAGYTVTGVQRVTPTLFLKVNSNISSGTGSSSDPYKLSVNNSPALVTLNRLTALNPDVKLDTTKTPDLTKPSGNSSTYRYDPYDGVTEPTKIENYGDGTNGIYEFTDTIGPTYYFRGAVENNYVQFAGFTWRIIRINGDGSIRMITDNAPITNQKYNTVYNTQDKVNYEGSDIETAINNWYNTNIGNNSTYASKVVDTIFCNDRSIFKEENGYIYYSGWNRLYKSKMPSLECNTNDRLIRKAALITQDEAMMVGYGRENDGDYWESDYNTNNYLRKAGINFWTMTPNMFAWGYASVLGVYDYGFVVGSGVDGYYQAGCPVVSLRSDAITGGMGTSSDPFIVN